MNCDTFFLEAIVTEIHKKSTLKMKNAAFGDSLSPQRLAVSGLNLRAVFWGPL